MGRKLVRGGEDGHLLGPRPDGFERPLLIRESTGLELGVDQIAVDTELKATTTRRNQPHLTDLLFVRRQELARQTDGLRLVISHRTVFEFHLHDFSFRVDFPICSETANVERIH